GRPQILVDGTARRIHLDRELVLDQRLFELAGRCQASAPFVVMLGGAKLGALEGRASVDAVGLEPGRLRVLDDREVVVLPSLGVASPRERSRRGATAQGEAGEDEGDSGRKLLHGRAIGTV